MNSTLLKGSEIGAEMAATHEGWVVEMFGALSRDEQAQLMALLARLKGGLAGPGD